MAAKTRILSQSKAVYATTTGVLAGPGGTPSGVQATQLHRVDNFSWEVDIAGARQDIREFGQLARIGTLVNSDLNSTFSIGYLLTDGENEHHLGFEVKDSITGNFVPKNQAVSGFLTEHPLFRERNIFVAVVPEGQDANAPASWTDRTQHDVIGFGNAFITDYAVELAVGEIPRADLSFEANNLAFYTGTSSGLYNPSINTAVGGQIDSGQVALPIASTGNSEVDVLRPGQISLDLQASTPLGIGGSNIAQIHPQSVSLSIPLAREALTELGGDLPYSRPLTFPIDVTLSVSAVAGGYQAGQIAGLLTGCGGQEKRDITVKLFDRCDSNKVRMAFILKNAVMDSQSSSQDLDGNETVEMQFSTQIAGATTVTDGIFMTGSYDTTLGSPLSPVYVSGLVG
jgi:hypothetical protein